jgi:conserved oligomeric Golgi complex subunit 2
MSTRFYLTSPNDSSSSLSSTSDSGLPFPAPLSRSAFLTPDFTPTNFLSTLTTRFQTLEDLRSELSSLSTSIQNELVDLVNDNYADFLGLGEKLDGGEEMVEEVRVGLMGFERDVGLLREKVVREQEGVRVLMEEKRGLMGEMSVGRGLLEVEERMGELELDLSLKEREKTAVGEDSEKEDWGDDWDDGAVGESDDEGEGDLVPRRLNRRADEFAAVLRLFERLGEKHPFLVAQQGRMRKIRDVLLRDLDAAIRAEPDVKGKQAIMNLRRTVEE